MVELEIPSVRDLRSVINGIDDPRTQYLCKITYLLAARIDEVCTKVTTGQNTKAYGQYLIYKFEKHKKSKDTMLVKVPVLKRKTKNPAEPNFRYVALPTHPTIEPWTMEILKHLSYVRKQEVEALKECKRKGKKISRALYAEIEDKLNMKLGLHMTRQWAYQLIRQEIYPKFGLEPNPKEHFCNILRHYRASHLIDHYDFDLMDLVSYCGWSIRQSGGAMGFPTGQADIYLHLKWRRYRDKLNVPYQDLVS